MSKNSLLRTQIKIIDYGRFIINFLTAALLIGNAYIHQANLFVTSVAWLLLLGWVLGFIERRLISIRRARMTNEIRGK